jgi:murein DD-endopeptidase MepM/ murein hydrolase activator NlpD
MRRSASPATTQVFAARYALPWLMAAIFLAVVILALPEPAIAYVDPPGYLLPWTAEQLKIVIQGWMTGTHNTNNSRYAYDFGLSANTPVRASRAGTVAWTKDWETGCSDVDPNRVGNGIVINHTDGTATLYMHLAPTQNGLPYGVIVANGNHVHQGAVIGRSGNTGYVIPCNNGTSGYHLHFNHQAQGGQPWATSQAVYFEEYPG